MERLRICPFCGSNKANLYKVKTHFDNDKKYVVQCGICGSYGPSDKNRDMAQKFWNGYLLDLDSDELENILNENVASVIKAGLRLRKLKKQFDSAKDVIQNKANEEVDKFYQENDISEETDMCEAANIAGYKKSINLFHKLKYIYETEVGGVSSPMSTLNNTPGMGNVQPASTAATTGAQQSSDAALGSGDNFGGSLGTYSQRSKPKRKKSSSVKSAKRKTSKRKTNKRKSTQTKKKNEGFIPSLRNFD